MDVIKKMIKKIFTAKGFNRISKKYPQTSDSSPIIGDARPWVRDLSTTKTVSRLKKIGIEINSVIDIGASDGRWSADILPYYPDAEYLLVEANPYHYPALNKFIKRHKKMQSFEGAAGNKNKTICFHAGDPFSGLALDSEVTGDGIIRVQSNTVDNLVADYYLQPKHLLKLDTHGFEVPIFEGAKETLKNTNLIIVETYSFQINDTSLKFYEICKYLDELGFSPVDFSEPLWREKDGMFWQFDLFFIPSNHPSLQYNGYN